MPDAPPDDPDFGQETSLADAAMGSITQLTDSLTLDDLERLKKRKKREIGFRPKKDEQPCP